MVSRFRADRRRGVRPPFFSPTAADDPAGGAAKGTDRSQDGLGIGENFLHLDCLASEMRLNVDLDAALTLIANGCDRWLASRLHGFEKAAPKHLYRRFIETAGTVTIQEDRLTVTLDRRCHNPIVREAELDRHPLPIPWIGRRRLVFTYR